MEPGPTTEAAQADVAAQEARRHQRVRRLAHARLRRLAARADGNALREYHAGYKYLLMACDPAGAKRLGHIAAAAPPPGRDASGAYAEYASALARALAEPPTRGGHVNALLHMFGYISESLAPAERATFLELIERYRAGEEPLGTAVRQLHEWIARRDVAYLGAQRYFEPFLRKR